MQPRIPEVVLFDELGRGPGGAVFRGAYRGKACTIKLPHAPRLGFHTEHGFEQDVLQLARLRHAGLPSVISLDATDETAYAILESQQGRSLVEVLAEALPEHAATELALRLTTCIAELHAAGFVHGDLSTAHVLWSEATRRVHLLDTGSVHRPLPFDTTVDSRALGTILRQLAAHVVSSNVRRTELSRIIHGWLSGPRATLSQLVQELVVRNHTLTSALQPSTRTFARKRLLTHSGHVRSELTLLRRRWETRGHHDGKVLMMVGAPGSGKSRLLRGFLDYLKSQDTLVLAIKCADGDWAPFSAIKRLLERHLRELGRLDSRRRARLEAALRDAAGPMAAQLRLLSPQLAHVFRATEAAAPEGDAQQVFVDGVAEFLANYLEAAEHSALIIDDIHWLDASSRMVLSRLATRICSHGHFMVCAARDDEDVRESIDRFDAMLPSGLLEKLALGPLTDNEARDVVAEFLGVDEISQSAIVEPLSRLSDGTPLSLLELLDLAIERRLLRPHRGTWQLDWLPLQQMRLPASSRALIERRMSLLEPTTIKALRTAAIIGNHISARVLAEATPSSDDEARVALDRAARARLLVRGPDDHYEFVHDSVWEALLRPLQAHEQRALHQRVAEALWRETEPAFDHHYELARHLAAGDVSVAPRRTYETLRHAGQRAIAASDDRVALSFLKPAERAAELAQIELQRDFYVDLAESSLRTGATEESLAYFELALRRSRPGMESAHVRGRIAWLHHYESHAVAAWSMLDAALLEYGRRLPNDDELSVIRAGLGRLTRPTRKRGRVMGQAALETLCELYWLTMRVALESGRPMTAFAAIIHLAIEARQLAPCRVLVQAELVTAFAFALVSRRLPWRSKLARAQTLARQLADPIALTFCHQIQSVIAGWLGDIEEAQRHARIAVDERGQYMELGELCIVCYGMYLTEVGLGRPELALSWLERAIARAQQFPRAPAVLVLIHEAASTTLQTLGREHEIPDLNRRLARVQRSELRPGSYFHLLCYQARVARLIDDDELGAPFESLLREWQAHKQDPKQAHLAVLAFYIHVAHARVHQCLRAQPFERAALIVKLTAALADVELGAREPITLAHASVTRAALCWLRADDAGCARALARAEELARERNGVWVIFAAARLRAHMFKARDKHAAARDEARHAAAIARQYGSRQRLRTICEEFELSEFLLEGKSTEVDTPSVRRHLDALLHIAQASSRDLGPSRQARFIVEELLETLAAERGVLFMRDAVGGTLQCHAACHATGQELSASQLGYDQELVDQVYATGQTLLAGCEADAPTGRRQDRACIVVALVLREQVVGVLYMDRHAAAGSFSNDDVALIEALANQVPVALELAGALRERERLEQNLRQAQKMEAIGRLAGGIAHDFNNILATIEFAAGCLATQVTPKGEEDLSEIRDASRRGADLTRQLLMFSRGKSVPPRRVDLVEVLQRVGPMLSRMVRANVQIEMNPHTQPLLTMADPSQIERLLMNLCRNASDAMPDGGSIAIQLGPATDLPEHLISPTTSSGSTKATHATLTVVDTGTGMTEEVRARLFEPFFTTKASQQGTGLGLAIVYTIVKQYGGHIEVASEPGAGATFRIHLPLCHDLPLIDQVVLPGQLAGLSRFSPEPANTHAHDGRTTLLVVDDDDVLRKQSARMLEAAGFQILTASDGEDALRVVAHSRDVPELAITDVQMPGMDGAQLAERLRTGRPDIKLVFVSGDGPDSLISRGALGDSAVFLQKPFKPEALLREVETLLNDAELPPRHSGVFKLGISANDEIDGVERPS